LSFNALIKGYHGRGAADCASAISGSPAEFRQAVQKLADLGQVIFRHIHDVAKRSLIIRKIGQMMINWRIAGRQPASGDAPCFL
jgi:hypothetical protein